MADNYSNGRRFNGNGSVYTTSDPTSPTPSYQTTPSMGALGILGQITAYGRTKISAEPTALFIDQFDGVVVDSINRWTLSGTSPTQNNGALTLNAGTTANATSVASSQAVFNPPGGGFRIFGTAMNLSSPKVPNQNTHTFFGVGQVTSYAIGTPLTDGFGFEVDITGELNCVAWVSGTRYVANSTNPALITPSISLPTGGAAIATAAMSWPTAGPHIYSISDRGDSAFFYIDSLDAPVAIFKNVQPNVQGLPLRFAQINAAASVLASTAVASGLLIADSTAQNHTISDSTFAWRRLQIGKDGAANVSIGGLQTVAVAAAASANVKTTAGRLGRVLITSAGTTSLTFYDNAAGNSTGTIIGITPAVTSIGQIYDFNIPAAAGISAVGAAGTPGVTIGFS